MASSSLELAVTCLAPGRGLPDRESATHGASWCRRDERSVMEYVAPAAAISSRLALGPSQTGLVGTVRFRLIDNDSTADDPVFGPTTAGIVEDPSGSGSYVWTGTAPSVQGKYSPAWDKGAGTPLMYDEDV